MSYDSAGGTGAEAFEVWHETCRPVLGVVNRDAERDFESVFSFVEVGGLVFNRVHYSAATFKRTDKLIRGSDDSPFVLHLMLTGGESGIAGKNGEHALEMRPDRIVLSDWAVPYVSCADATDQISVAIPRGFIECAELLSGNHPVVSWSLSTGTGRLLAETLTHIWESLPALDPAEGRQVASGFLGLLNGLLVRPGTLPSDAATLALMKTCLRENLHHPRCGVEILLQRFPHSRASIYRLFAAHGGVQNFIREERLRSSYHALASGVVTGKSVAELARIWGYSDASHFHRSFKKRFEMTPGEVVESFGCPGSGRSPTGSANLSRIEGSIEELHRWLGAGI